MPNDKIMTIEQLAAKAIEDIEQMSADEKAHLRAKLQKAFGIEPEPSGKPN